MSTAETSFSKESKKEFVLILSNLYKVPKDLIDKILFIFEPLIAKKNLLFLSFYHPGFIDTTEIKHVLSTPKYQFYRKTILLNNHLQANFIPGNPYKENDQDHISILNTITKQHVTINQQEDIYITLIFEQLIKIIPHFQFETFKECELINAICSCTTLDQVERLSKKLPTIPSLQLRFALFEKLRMVGYLFWHSLEWNEKQETAGLLKKHTGILIHPHFFNWHIRPLLTNDENAINLYKMTKNDKRIIIKGNQLILGKKGPFDIAIDCNPKTQLIAYPHSFVAIFKRKNKSHTFSKFSKKIPEVPTDLAILLFQLGQKFNLPSDVLKQFVSAQLLHYNKTLIFLSFYDDFIKPHMLLDSNPDGWSYKNNDIKLKDELVADFYPIYTHEDKNEIHVYKETNRCPKATYIYPNSFFSQNNKSENFLITEIFNSMHQRIKNFNDYKKLSYTDTILIDRIFKAKTLEEISSLLQWLPTVPSKHLEKIIWSLLIEKAGHSWCTITINNKLYWKKEKENYCNHFVEGKVNKYALAETNCIPIPCHSLKKILNGQVLDEHRDNQRQINTKPGSTIYHKTSIFNITYSGEKDSYPPINGYPHSYAWVKAC